MALSFNRATTYLDLDELAATLLLPLKILGKGDSPNQGSERPSLLSLPTSWHDRNSAVLRLG